MKTKKNKLLVYVIAIFIPLAVGALSGLLSMNGMEDFSKLEQPPLSPPGWLFPVVWSVLYVLMGISSARIFLSDDRSRRKALTFYAIQLILNALWSPIFFALELRLVAFVWLLFLIAAVIKTIVEFKRIDAAAGDLQFPYLIWLLFAAYLNMGTYLLNR